MLGELPTGRSASMHKVFLNMLECPGCHGLLSWNISEQRGERIEEAEARCTACGATYPVQKGIAFFLVPDLARHDLWEQAESHLSRYLSAHAEVERQLMDSPVEQLSAADQLLRAMVLTDRGAYSQAQSLHELAISRLYTPQYLACLDSEIKQLASSLSPSSWPLVDLASGGGTLIEMLVRQIEQPVIASDFSPTILRRNRRQLEFLGLADRVTLLAFDARRTPFKQGAVKTMTTLLGLSNIEHPTLLLQELRRIISGSLLAIVYFFPEGDQEANTATIHAKMDPTFFFRRTTVEQFAAVGWQVELMNVCMGRAQPTPGSVILPGTQIDGLPVAETTLEWGLLVAQ